MIEKTITIKYSLIRNITDLDTEDQELIQRCKEASMKAYAPYSSFHVGAAVLLVDGTIYTGNNQENAAYPSGLCAERVALFYAGAEKPDLAVKTLAICANKQGLFTEKPVSPCGACRQVISETTANHGHPIKLILYGDSEIQIFENANDLLPFSFNHSHL